MNTDSGKTIFCTQCGQSLPAGAMVCPKCGTVISQPTAPLAEAIDPASVKAAAQEPVVKPAVCQKCGRELQPGWAACPNCGDLVSPEEIQTKPETVTPPPTDSKPKRNGMGWLLGLGILALVLGCGLVVALGFLFNTTQNLLMVEGELDRVAQTATAAQAGLQITLESQLATQSAAEAQLLDQQSALENQALAFSATSTAQVAADQEALRLQQEAFQATLSAAMADLGQVIYGPIDGELLHKVDGFIETAWADVNVTNLIIEARFYNPYGTEEGPWDYGFMFRHTDTNEQYRLVISSDGQWHFIIARGDDRPELAVGPIANLDLTAGGSNLVNLWVKDGTANLYVNNQWITALDVSEKIVAGDAAVCTGFYTGYEIEGKITRYEGFEVSELP